MKTISFRVTDDSPNGISADQMAVLDSIRERLGAATRTEALRVLLDSVSGRVDAVLEAEEKRAALVTAKHDELAETRSALSELAEADRALMDQVGPLAANVNTMTRLAHVKGIDAVPSDALAELNETAKRVLAELVSHDRAVASLHYRLTGL